MRERPILFNSEMVKAILDGRKTQTRRVLKPQPPKLKNGNFDHIPTDWHEAYQLDATVWQLQTKEVRPHVYSAGRIVVTDPFNCPFGKPGDRLWVRETRTKYQGTDVVHYRADGEQAMINWRPSIHMPRWASRINLEITNVGVQRLKDISENDAIKEGFVESDDYTPKGAFKKTWNDIYQNWNENPWVWVEDFKRL